MTHLERSVQRKDHTLVCSTRPRTFEEVVTAQDSMTMVTLIGEQLQAPRIFQIAMATYYHAARKS
jgi:hypothetical protein